MLLPATDLLVFASVICTTRSVKLLKVTNLHLTVPSNYELLRFDTLYPLSDGAGIEILLPVLIKT